MNPGRDCLSCHSAAGEASEERFTLAGTVFGSPSAKADAGIADVTVIVTDANGAETTLTSNAAGNFFTDKALALPLRAAAVVRNGKRTTMSAAPSSGACNGCHNEPPAQGAPGRLYAPQ